VRELENIIERAAALTDDAEIGLTDLPSDLRELSISSVEGRGWPSLEEKNREYIQQVLMLTDGRRGEAAEILGLPRTTLWRMMKRFGLT
jgi:transcriptional regulator of acetoin/glycerol metabolism